MYGLVARDGKRRGKGEGAGKRIMINSWRAGLLDCIYISWLFLAKPKKLQKLQKIQKIQKIVAEYQKKKKLTEMALENGLRRRPTL